LILGKRPILPDLDFDESYNLILALFYCCTEEDATKRPDASDIVKLLSSEFDLCSTQMNKMRNLNLGVADD